MSKKSRSRRQARRAAFKYAGQEFYLTDSYSAIRITLRNPLRLMQLVKRGWAEQINQRTIRLVPLFALASAKLADNGEPMLRSVTDERLWPNGTACPTHRICETAWLMSGASFTLQQVDAAIAERADLIEQETLRWGLPDGKKPVLREDWGSFGKIDYIGKVA